MNPRHSRKSRPRKRPRSALAPARPAAAGREPRAAARSYFGVNWILLADPDTRQPGPGSEHE